MILEEIHYSIIQVISDYDEDITASSTQTLSISCIHIFKRITCKKKKISFSFRAAILRFSICVYSHEWYFIYLSEY